MRQIMEQNINTTPLVALQAIDKLARINGQYIERSEQLTVQGELNDLKENLRLREEIRKEMEQERKSVRLEQASALGPQAVEAKPVTGEQKALPEPEVLPPAKAIEPRPVSQVEEVPVYVDWVAKRFGC
jgi:hypothetical protein